MLVGNGFIFTKNFYNDNNNMKPVHRWMHQNRARQGFRMGKGRTEYIATYTNSKRVSTYGWRILRWKDHLAH